MILHFRTKSGLIVPAVSTDQMIEVDRIATENTGPNLFQMMENAGRNLALSAIDILGSDWKNSKIIILCGTGGNGGGGICAARHLANRNANVKICLTEKNKFGTVPAYQHKVYRSTKGEEIVLSKLQYENPDLIIDAIIGYSLKSPPRGNSLEMINWANSQPSKTLSLDVPSGVDTTTGETPGKFIKADRTLTLALPKTGLLTELAGDLYLADIGIPEKTYTIAGINYSSPFGEKFIVRLE